MPSFNDPTRHRDFRGGLLAAAAVGLILVVGALVLQRYVAATRSAAIVLVAAWYAAIGIGGLIFVLARRRRWLAVLGTWALVVAASVVIGYWTGFRDRRVDEDVVVARSEASAQLRAAALSGERRRDRAANGGSSHRGPVSIATGRFVGQDGHAGTGIATVVAESGGQRVLTFTRFDVDPGLDVAVYLTPTTTSVEDRVDLGGLKGNIGDQQYVIPPEVDLDKYDSVVLWCRPFTVRIATADLS
jgi:hypothetical protein